MSSSDICLNAQPCPKTIPDEVLKNFHNALKYYLNTRSNYNAADKVFCCVSKITQLLEQYGIRTAVEFDWFAINNELVIQLSQIIDSTNYEVMDAQMDELERLIFSDIDSNGENSIKEIIKSIQLKSQPLFNGTHVCTSNIVCNLPSR